MAAAPTVRQRRLGAELRRLRESLGPTAEEIAARLDWSSSKISRIENARIGVRVSDVRLLLELYQVDEGHTEEILALAQAATQRGWWSQYRRVLPEEFAKFVALEDEANTALTFATYTVPGLLQDEEYAKSTLESSKAVTIDTPSEISFRLDVRMRRQQLLFRKDNPLTLAAIIDESVLLRMVGNRGVMRRQMLKLITLADLPNVEIYVLPLSVHREPVIGESFILLEFLPAHDVIFSDVIYIDNSWMTAAEFQDDTVTHRYGRSWRALREVADSAEDSMGRISRYAREMWSP